MKIICDHLNRPGGSGLGALKRSEGGSATIVFIALLAIMVILVMVNGKALFRLHREVKFIEQKQINRLSASQTNGVAAAPPESK